MAYTQITAQSTGYTGAPGWHRMKFIGQLTTTECNTVAAAMRNFYLALNSKHPSIWKINWLPTAQVFTDAGVLTGEVAITSIPAQVTGTGASGYPGGVGAMVQWNTGAINGGHKVRGRTYLVPFVNGCYDTDGTLVSTVVSDIQAAAASLLTVTPLLAINSRSLGKPGRGDQTVSVISATVPDRAAVLASRRT